MFLDDNPIVGIVMGGIFLFIGALVISGLLTANPTPIAFIVLGAMLIFYGLIVAFQAIIRWVVTKILK